MSKHTLAVVCALAFVAGGAAAFAVNYTPGSPSVVQGVHEERAVAAETGATETAEPRVAEDAKAEEVSAPEDGGVAATQTDEATGEPAYAEGESADVKGVAVGGAATSAGVAGVRAGSGERAGEGAREARGYARVSRARASSGGGSIAGHTVGGVKKTGAGVKKAGAAIGKTFGKIGGVFHD